MGKINDYVGQAKSWLKSRTVWFGLASLINAALIYFGADPGTDINVIVDEGFEGASALAEYADSIWAIVLQAVSTAGVIWGRFVATLPISIFGSTSDNGTVPPPK